MGGRIKYLVDTPEVIWGFLDVRQYMDAGRRFLRAQIVHQLLHTSCSNDTLSRFPLLNHQWPVVEKFKCVCCCLLCGGVPTRKRSAVISTHVDLAHTHAHTHTHTHTHTQTYTHAHTHTHTHTHTPCLCADGVPIDDKRLML